MFWILVVHLVIWLFLKGERGCLKKILLEKTGKVDGRWFVFNYQQYTHTLFASVFLWLFNELKYGTDPYQGLNNCVQ